MLSPWGRTVPGVLEEQSQEGWASRAGPGGLRGGLRLFPQGCGSPGGLWAERELSACWGGGLGVVSLGRLALCVDFSLFLGPWGEGCVLSRLWGHDRSFCLLQIPSGWLRGAGWRWRGFRGWFVLSHPHPLKGRGWYFCCCPALAFLSTGGSGLKAGWRPPEVWKSPPATLPPKQPSGAGGAAAFLLQAESQALGGFLEEVVLSFLLRKVRWLPHLPPGLFLTVFPFPGFTWGQETPRKVLQDTPHLAQPGGAPCGFFRLIFHGSCRPISLNSPT